MVGERLRDKVTYNETYSPPKDGETYSPSYETETYEQAYSCCKFQLNLLCIINAVQRVSFLMYFPYVLTI